MSTRDTVHAIPLTSFDATALNPVNWQPINPGGLLQPCYKLRIVNDSPSNIEISFDGVNAHDFIQDGQSYDIMAQVFSRPNNQVAMFRRGTIVYVRGAAQQNQVRIYLSGYFNLQQA